MLLGDRKWSISFLTRGRNYISITRPEDLNFYDYVASFQKGQMIDFKECYHSYYFQEMRHLHSSLRMSYLKFWSI